MPMAACSLSNYSITALVEHFVAGHQLFATSDGNTKTFTFPSNLPNPPQTTGRTMLIATPGFAALPGGVTPDYTLPDPAVFGAFFDPAATIITINFSNVDSITISGPFLPRNGVQSIIDANPTGTPTLVIATNSPTHFTLATSCFGFGQRSPVGRLQQKRHCGCGRLCRVAQDADPKRRYRTRRGRQREWHDRRSRLHALAGAIRE